MVFISIYPNPEKRLAEFLIIRSFFKNVRKHYVWHRQWETRFDEEDLEVLVESEYLNSEYAEQKRLYSQEGRPTKKIVARPSVLLDASRIGIEPVQRLRGSDVPIEAFFWDRNPKGMRWRKEQIGKAQGNNYHVSIGEIFKVLQKVHTGGRLLPDEDRTLVPEITRILEKEAGKTHLMEPRDLPPWLIALGMPIWFRETIRYSRAYRA